MDDFRAELQEGIGYRFSDDGLLTTSLTHRSAVAEGDASESFERMEFLGDAVLDLVVAELLYQEYPVLAEGEMAKTRASVVGETMLAEIAADVGVGPALLLGVGEERTGGRDKASILADALEAIIGAVYLEAGFDVVAGLILGLWRERVAELVEYPGEFDYKSRLQELVAATNGSRPEYEVAGSGPDHAREFRAEVSIDGSIAGVGVGSSKKRAEQEAARAALEAAGGA